MAKIQPACFLQGSLRVVYLINSYFGVYVLVQYGYNPTFVNTIFPL